MKLPGESSVCAAALVTTDKKMKRISAADPTVQIKEIA
jgi:hypothetical protein